MVRPETWGRILLVAVLLVVTAGCDEKERIAELEARLAEAKEEVALMREAAAACENTLDDERAKSAELRRVIEDDLPVNVPAFLEAEIVELVPPESRPFVEERLLLYLEVMNNRFEDLQASNEQVRRDVARVRREVEEEGQLSRQELEVRMGGLQEQLDRNAREMTGYIDFTEDLRERLEQVAERVDRFDNEHVACRGCWSVFDYKEKKDVILGFHAELRRELLEMDRKADRDES